MREENERWGAITTKNDDRSSEDNEQVMLEYGRLQLMIGHDGDDGKQLAMPDDGWLVIGD
jgi:hypothetical protein